MTINRRHARFEPITWHVVRITSRAIGPGFGTRFDAARAWCRQHAGVERADWEYQWQHRRWRFRDEDVAFLFQLTWG